MENNTEVEPSTFAEDVKEGLSSSPKRLSSKYFYDDNGSRIFQEIMEMPEYYLTNAEHDILCKQSENISNKLSLGNEFSIIELGAGDGKKTFELLSYLLEAKFDIHYRPVDISAEAIKLLEKDLNQNLPDLHIQSLVGDYFHVLGSLPKRSKPALFLFLGSNIGNYEKQQAIDLMQKFQSFLQKGDMMLTGFDIVKNPRTILNAYDDAQGITRRFNLNLLERMNRELGMDINVEDFDFYPYYNPTNGEVRSCLVSLKSQKVYSQVLEKTFTFKANELIHTELSKKYSFDEIEELGSRSGFQVVEHFTDGQGLFTDSLWVKA